MSRWLVAVLACLVVAPLAGAAVPAAATGSPPALDVAQQGQFDHTTFVNTVHENGSARWTFRYTRILDNESERANFEAYAAEFNANETDLYRDFRDRATQLAAQGSDATGREMAASGFTREAFVTTGATADQGVVEMSFLWTGFAATDGERVRVGDVFEGGLYLGEAQSLRIEAGTGLAFASVTPDPDAQSPGGVALAETTSVTWDGERQFAHLQPSVELGPPGATTPAGGDGGLGPWAVVGAVVVLVLGLVAAFAWRRRGSSRSPAETVPPAGDDDGESVGPTGEVAGEPAVPDEELLSDEDRVLRLLEDNGGRMKQVQIVDETGWSKSKVSMLLSDMEDADDISKLRVGRENVVSLRGHEPEAAKSPFADEEDRDRRTGDE